MHRGINLAAHNRIKMDELKAAYVALRIRDPQTFIQSGNVIFRTEEQDLVKLAGRIESAIEKKFSIRSRVILRTASELRQVVESNPFAARTDIEPNKLLVTFLSDDPGQEARGKVAAVNTEPEELRIAGREMFIYFANGMARPKISMANIEKLLKTSGTGRNWNSVQKMLAIAERLEAS
jgi:uncharacterized protein (DUF1697 family)